MKTAKQIKKEARERFDEKFTYVSDLRKLGGCKEKMVGKTITTEVEVINSAWPAKEIKHFLDQLIDTTIKQVLEGVGVEENPTITGGIINRGRCNCNVFGAEIKGWNNAVKQQTKLAKEIE